jgi:hypothetical protein
VITGKIELNHVKATLLTIICKLNPVFFIVCSHNRSYQDFVRELLFEFFGSFNPVPGFLFCDQLNVGEGWFITHRIVCGFENTRRHIGDFILIENECLNDCESPSLLKGSPDHWI